MLEGQRTWVLSALGHRSSPDPSLRLPRSTTPARKPGSTWPDALRPGETILLVPALLGTGGTGKTQLAVGFAHAMWSARAVDLLAWVPAGNRSAIIAGYARAAADLGLLADDETAAGPADGAAQRFLDWLRTTERRWAVVLDGVASPVDIDGLWPQRPGGAGRRDQPAAGVGARLVRRRA